VLISLPSQKILKHRKFWLDNPCWYKFIQPLPGQNN
jgi:hypothetical protein